MPRLRNPQYEIMAQELARGQYRDDAYVAAGFVANRGNANRMSKRPEIVARVAELKKLKIINLGFLDLPRVLIELARLASLASGAAKPAVDAPGAIWVEVGVGVTSVQTLRIELPDHRGALSALLHAGSAARAGMDFNRCKPDDHRQLELVLRGILADRVIEDGQVGPSLLAAMAAVCEKLQPSPKTSAACSHEAAP